MALYIYIYIYIYWYDFFFKTNPGHARKIKMMTVMVI